MIHTQVIETTVMYFELFEDTSFIRAALETPKFKELDQVSKIKLIGSIAKLEKEQGKLKKNKIYDIKFELPANPIHEPRLFVTKVTK